MLLSGCFLITFFPVKEPIYVAYAKSRGSYSGEYFNAVQWGIF